ncbi:MAG TPA: uracil-DNA glycosylase [Syntrophales bacterium]|nr:uracil-DNA glycosylase [Syntrophales bacterium]HQJ29835.1 uracil-DNA glycosylase [Syntrophales bacterium]
MPEKDRQEMLRLIRSLRYHLEAERAAGGKRVTFCFHGAGGGGVAIPLPKEIPPALPGVSPPLLGRKEREDREDRRRERSEARKPETAVAAAAGLTPPGVMTGDLGKLRAELGECRRCPLHGGRKNIVFGEGNPRASLVFVGEAPGADEDAQGRPFVGRAGQLLTKIIEAMKMKRQEVYICNILKCRPPGNRNPAPGEIAACEPFLLRQLEAISPRAICALGTFAAQTLLKTDAPISILRGRWHRYHDIPLMPTYHPAYLLRNPVPKRQVWEDVQQIMNYLEDLKREERQDHGQP